MLWNEPMQIAICDDTPEDIEKLVSIISKNPVSCECTIFHSGEELLAGYAPDRFDLLLTDIYMNGINGVETVTKIREIDEHIPIAFVTTSTDHALEGYRLSVLKYIEKPYVEKDIDDILKLAKMEKDNAPAFIVEKNRKIEKIPFHCILYLEQQTHLLNIYLKNGQVLQVYDKISHVLPQMEDQDFFVPHKSFVVNLAYVKYIDVELKCFMMANNKNVPIRRETMSKAKKALD